MVPLQYCSERASARKKSIMCVCANEVTLHNKLKFATIIYSICTYLKGANQLTKQPYSHASIFTAATNHFSHTHS